MNESEIALFWQRRTDREICEALGTFVARQYGFEKDRRPVIENHFFRRIHAVIHVYNYLIDVGWEKFSDSVWNTPDFFEAIGYFNARVREEFEHRIRYYDPTENEEHGDSVQTYAIDTEIVLRFHIFSAVRLHRREFDSILERIEPIILENIKRRDAIAIEKWKADF